MLQFFGGRSKGKDEVDLFSIEVCTPKWILENHQSSDIVFGKSKMIVFEYDIDKIINAINQYLNSIICHTWEEAAIQIAKIANWEFENYKP